jgi:hypothetical protein
VEASLHVRSGTILQMGYARNHPAQCSQVAQVANHWGQMILNTQWVGGRPLPAVVVVYVKDLGQA